MIPLLLLLACASDPADPGGPASIDTGEPSPVPAELTLTMAELPAVLVGTDRLELSVSGQAEGPVQLQVQVELRSASGSRSAWLDPSCAEDSALRDCLSEEPLGIEGTSLDLPAIRAVHPEPAALTFSAHLLEPQGVAIAHSVLDPVLSLGRSLSWGDLHAHSNLSYDGCEDEAADCTPRYGCGAEDFFDNAAAAGLDFVALTDHAEWGWYQPDGTPLLTCDIWAEQQARVQEAEGVVALLGYEWTNTRSRPVDESSAYEGGHKTVLFRDANVPEDFRVAAVEADGSTWKGTGVYWKATGPTASDPEQLRAALDLAAAEHGDLPVLSFFHHPAIEAPQGVDFANPVNAPDPSIETLIELYSEHGSSECLDTTADDCDWMINAASWAYLTRGSAQYALSQGFRLGFTAGTDGHDARPGSIDDGPSWHGSSAGSAEEAASKPPHQQFSSGGLTGVWTADELDRDSLFEGLRSRATVATSGPRPVVRALAIDDQGVPWLPGSELPADRTGLQVVASVQAEGYTVARLSLVDRDGVVVAEAEGGELEQALTVEGDNAWYLRAVLFDDEDGSEQRVWVSPWFAGD